MKEHIYYVDGLGRPTGEIDEKLNAHHANTKLHAAFSCYVFNTDGKILVTQRAHTKKVWPGVWTNSCCGHPMPGEEREDAILRRLSYELGMTARDITCVLPHYVYKAPAYIGIVEHEFCPVYVAVAMSEPHPNPNEVNDFRWLEWREFIDILHTDSDNYSVFAQQVPRDDELGLLHPPKWSWWCKDQITLLDTHPIIRKLTTAR